MKNDDDYKIAYEREKQARRVAEDILQKKTHELYLKNLELIEHQQKLVQTEKLAAIGTLSAGVAHEINNPLSFVISNVNILKNYFQNLIESLSLIDESIEISSLKELNDLVIEKKISRYTIEHIIKDGGLIFEELDDGLNRVKDIVANLNSFSRSSNDSRELVSINDAINDALRILHNEVVHKCKLELFLSDVSHVYCNINKVSQVFLNILMNALQALDKQGTITIKSEEIKDFLVVTIKDDGKGIEPTKIKQIFVPFFTDKPQGSGTGLGLSISYGIIKSLGGTIEVESMVGVGSTFRVKIPVEQRKTCK